MRRMVLLACGVLAALVVFSVLVSILAGFASDIPRLKAANPSLLPHLRLFFIALARQLSR